MTSSSTQKLRAIDPVTKEDGLRWQRSSEGSETFEHFLAVISAEATSAGLGVPDKHRSPLVRVSIVLGVIALTLVAVVSVLPQDQTIRRVKPLDATEDRKSGREGKSE